MIRRIAILVVLVTGLAVPAPSAFAHGNQFICARVTLGNDGQVALELTADYGDNPNIADVTEARQVLRECLQVDLGDQCVPLEQLAPLRFVERDHYSQDSPVPPASEPGAHRLVTASWRVRLPGQRLAFAAKEHTPFDVVMWQAEAAPLPGQSRWLLLIAGDRSPLFSATMAAGVSGIEVQVMIAVLMFPLMVLFMRTITTRRLLVPVPRVPGDPRLI